jgi:hypothetical protein
MTVNTGVTVNMDGFQIQAGGPAGQAEIRDNGTVNIDGVAMTGNAGGTPIAVSTSAILNATDLTIDSAGVAGTPADITNQGTVTLTNATLTHGAGQGIGNSAPGTFFLNNTLISNQGTECSGGTDSNANPLTDGSADDDSSCGVQFSADSGLVTAATAGFPGASTNGGPFETVVTPAADLNGAGSSAKCPTTDGKFFVNPGGATRSCDVGAATSAAARETTPVSCVVTRTQYPPAVPIAQQDVTVTDPGGSGLGPEYGADTDSMLAAGSTPINPDDAITNLVITNGSVAFTPFTQPMNSGLVLTATKGSNPAVNSTMWQFNATNWAGITKLCK